MDSSADDAGECIQFFGHATLDHYYLSVFACECVCVQILFLETESFGCLLQDAHQRRRKDQPEKPRFELPSASQRKPLTFDLFAFSCVLDSAGLWETQRTSTLGACSIWWLIPSIRASDRLERRGGVTAILINPFFRCKLIILREIYPNSAWKRLLCVCGAFVTALHFDRLLRDSAERVRIGLSISPECVCVLSLALCWVRVD